MVPDQLNLVRLVDHVDVAVVSRVWVTGMCTSVYLDSFIDAVTRAVKSCALAWITDAEVLLVFAAIKLHK